MLSLECESKSTERNQYMKDIIIKLFNMEPSDIEQFEVIPCGSVIQCNITLQHRPTPCPSCGKISRRVHDYYRRTLKHAVLVENDLIVVYRKRRYYCTACQKPFPENNPFSLPGKRISQATVIRIMKLLKRESITFSTAAELTDVSTTTVMKVFDEHAGIATVPLPRCLCIDEVYVSKYLQTEYACVLLDFDTGAIYDLIPSRKKGELSSYFSNINKGTRNYVKYISIDMWENYRDLAHRYFPNALVCVDSFHVVKNVNYAFDRVRIRIMNSYDRASEEYRLLKRFHWLLKKSRDNIDFESMINLHRYYYIVGSKYISPEALINRLLEIDPELEIAYTLKCDYDEINSIATYHNAGRYIDKYIEDLHVYGLPEFIPISKMLKNWKHEIVNSFLTYRGWRISNGPIESMNSRIKLIKRNANGYKNFYRFRLRCLYTLNKHSSIKF